MQIQGTGSTGNTQYDRINAFIQAKLNGVRNGDFSLTSTANPAEYQYITSQLKSALSEIYNPRDPNDYVALLQSVAGIKGDAYVIGKDTMKAFDELKDTSKAQGPVTKTGSMAALKSVAGMFDRLDVPADQLRLACDDVYRGMDSSSLWKNIVKAYVEEGKAYRIVQGTTGPDVEQLGESLKLLGLVDPDAKTSIYDGALMDGIRKFNLITRNPSDLAKMPSLSNEVGERTVVTIKKALELVREGKDWRDQENWKAFNYEKYRDK